MGAARYRSGSWLISSDRIAVASESGTGFRHNLVIRAVGLSEPQLVPAASGRVALCPGRDTMRRTPCNQLPCGVHSAPRIRAFRSQHKKGGLESVFSGVLVVEDIPADAEDHRPMPLHQGLEGRLRITSLLGGESRQQLGVRHPGDGARFHN